jgi:DNA-directed RNA polymerase specialized sigma subunit
MEFDGIIDDLLSSSGNDDVSALFLKCKSVGFKNLSKEEKECIYFCINEADLADKEQEILHLYFGIPIIPTAEDIKNQHYIEQNFTVEQWEKFKERSLKRFLSKPDTNT